MSLSIGSVRSRLVPLGLVIAGGLFGLPALAQTARPVPPSTPAPAAKTLGSEDAKRVEELEKTIITFRNDLGYERAVAAARRVLEIRTSAQGKDHWETVDARVRLETLERIVSLGRAERKEVNATYDQVDEARRLFDREKFADCLTLLKHALDMRRKHLGAGSYETAGCMNNLAMVLRSLGRYQDAQTYYEQAAEGIRRALGEDNPAVATAFSNLGLNLQELHQLEKSLTYHEKALAIVLRTVGPGSIEAALARNNLGMVLDALGQHAKARAHYLEALPIVLRTKGEESLETIRVRSNLAANALRLADYEEAESAFRRVLESCRKVFPRENTEIATVAMNLANALDQQGKYAEAEPLLREALAIMERVLSLGHPDTAGCINNLAANLSAQGRSAEAEALYRTALEIYRARLPDEHPRIARSYGNLAHVLSEQGRDAEAEFLSRRALEVWTKVAGEHQETANASNNLGMLLVDRRRYDEAEPLLLQSLAMRRKLLPPAHPAVAQSLNNLGGLFESRRQNAEAERYYREAYAIRRRRDPTGLDTAESCNNLAAAVKGRGQLEESERLNREALTIRESRLGREHALTGQSYNNLGNTLYDRGKYADAEEVWSTAARIFEVSRLRIGNSGMERVKFASERSPLVRLAALLARRGKPADAWQRLEEHLSRGLLDEFAARQDRHFTPSERDELRKRLAVVERLDRLFEAPVAGLGQGPAKQRLNDLRRRRDEALASLGELRQKLVASYGPMAGKVVTLAEIQAGLPADAALVTWVDRVAGPETANPDGEHWGVVVRAKGSPAWVRLPGTGEDRRWTDEDTRLTALVQSALNRPPGAGGTASRALLERFRAQRLAPLTVALQVTDDGLPAVHRLIVLPSAALAGIPIEALLEPSDPWIVRYAPSATVLTYLWRQPPVDTKGGLLALGDPVFDGPDSSKEPGSLPSHGLLLTAVTTGSNAARHELRTGDVLLAYGGTALQTRADLKIVAESTQAIPVEIWREGRVIQRQIDPGKLGVNFDLRPAPQAIGDRRRIDHGLALARATDSGAFHPLPGTRDEVEKLEKLFAAAHRPVRVLLGVKAAEPEMDRIAASGELGRYAYIHLATHGVIDNEAPHRSAVILTQTDLPDPLRQLLNKQPVFDGRLSVRKIQRGWNLNAALVTFSACETARGQYASGEGFIGFTQALLVSGARCVCLSLWKVDDTATSLLMQRFYQNLLGKGADPGKLMPKAEALREAKAWLRGLTVAQSADRTRSDSRKSLKGKPPAPLTRFDHPYYWAGFILIGDPN